MTREQRVRIPCGAITLEGVLDVPHGEAACPGVVICHPHPLYGGDMANNVVQGLTAALAIVGVATLRFNFRGVGESGGRHGGGEAELDDVRAAVDALAAADGVDGERLAVFGYSFGAWVGLRAAWEDERVCALAAVAPPLAAYSMDFLAPCPKPKLAVAGSRDEFCPTGSFQAWYRTLAPPIQEVVLEGTDHFFHTREAAVGRAAAAFATEWLRV